MAGTDARLLLLFMGAMGKSAQSCCTPGFRTPWKGRPVSALIHAATMVTAASSCGALSLCSSRRPPPRRPAGDRGLTSFFAATIALVKTTSSVIAYSTCSQLGYMFVALGAGAIVGISTLNPWLLQGAAVPGRGSVITAMHQADMRKMGAVGLHPFTPS